MKLTLLLGLILAAPAAFAAKPTLKDVLGKDLVTEKVRGIYRYACDRTYFEGEGVSVTGGQVEVACLANQRLGLITAPYSFYLYDSFTATNDQPPSNMGERSRGGLFEGGICLKAVARAECNQPPSLRYGLYGERAGVFQVGISLTTKPYGDGNEPTSAFTGFAALPNSQGVCPAGLVKARPWHAQPSSITQGSLGNNPPSSFINNNNVLNDIMVEIERPLPMKVKRAANIIPCTGTSTDPSNPTGSCAGAEFAKARTVQTNVFAATSPVVCVIPPELLEGAIP